METLVIKMLDLDKKTFKCNIFVYRKEKFPNRKIR